MKLGLRRVNNTSLQGGASLWVNPNYKFTASKTTPKVFKEKRIPMSIQDESVYSGLSLLFNDTAKEIVSTENNQKIDVLKSYQRKDPDHEAKLNRSLKDLYPFISKKVLITSVEPLRSISEYYFGGAQGKLFRPKLNIHLAKVLWDAKNIQDIKGFYDHTIFMMQKVFASLIESIHNTSLMQDDIIDKADSRRNTKPPHTIYGIRNTVNSTIFNVGRAGRIIAAYKSSELYTIYTTILKNLTEGEIMQASKFRDFNDLDQVSRQYAVKTYYKTASLLAGGCRAVALINGEEKEVRDCMERFGSHVGMAFQYYDDILDYTANSKTLGKPALHDLKSGVVTGPVLVALNESVGTVEREFLENCIKNRLYDDDNMKKISSIIFEAGGVEKVMALCIHHLEEAIDCLKEFEDVESHKDLVGFVTKTILRDH